MTIVAKLSSVRIITAASFETSVPVMPIATPMSAFLSAGASFTPSPVMATMWPRFLRMSTRWTLCSGATRAMTPISSIRRTASSSLMAANSAPVSARPSMPSWLAMAWAVTAWSPVIIRTRMPADFAFAIASLASGRAGSTMPTMREQRHPVEQRQQVGIRVERRRVEVLLAGRHDPQALLAEPIVLGQVGVADLGDRDLGAVRAVGAARRGREAGPGAPLTNARMTVLAVGVRHPVERRHDLVGRVERQRRDARVLLAGERRVDAALRGEHDQRALGRVADERAVLDLGIGAQGHRQQVLLERDVGLAAGVGDLAGRLVALAADRVAAAGDRHLDGGHLVERQRPGLVGVDRRGRAERLHGAQALHDGAGLRRASGCPSTGRP